MAKPRKQPKAGHEWAKIDHEQTICPFCMRWVGVGGTRITTHGPGRDSMFCEGGSTQANDTRRVHAIWFERKIKPAAGWPDAKPKPKRKAAKKAKRK